MWLTATGGRRGSPRRAALGENPRDLPSKFATRALSMTTNPSSSSSGEPTPRPGARRATADPGATTDGAAAGGGAQRPGIRRRRRRRRRRRCRGFRIGRGRELLLRLGRRRLRSTGLSGGRSGTSAATASIGRGPPSLGAAAAGADLGGFGDGPSLGRRGAALREPPRTRPRGKPRASHRRRTPRAPRNVPATAHRVVRPRVAIARRVRGRAFGVGAAASSSSKSNSAAPP